MYFITFQDRNDVNNTYYFCSKIKTISDTDIIVLTYQITAYVYIIVRNNNRLLRHGSLDTFILLHH